MSGKLGLARVEQGTNVLLGLRQGSLTEQIPRKDDLLEGCFILTAVATPRIGIGCEKWTLDLDGAATTIKAARFFVRMARCTMAATQPRRERVKMAASMKPTNGVQQTATPPSDDAQQTATQPHDGAQRTTTQPSERGPSGRAFVRRGQRFIGLLAGRRAWSIFGAITGLVALTVLGIFGLVIINLQDQLAQRQPYIVGLTTAHKIVPLFPDGSAAVTCDELCIDGELESWIGDLRKITGEQNPAQQEQHDAQRRALSKVDKASQAGDYVRWYYQNFNPFTNSAKGAKLTVRDAHVNAEVGVSNRYDAHWTDVVENAKTGQEIARRNFSAYIDAKSIPGARTDQNVIDNPGGVVITHVEQYGVTP